MNSHELEVLIKAGMVSKIRVAPFDTKVFGFSGQSIVEGFGSVLAFSENKHTRPRYKMNEATKRENGVLRRMVDLSNKGFTGTFELDPIDPFFNQFVATDEQIRLLIRHSLVDRVTLNDATDPIADIRESYHIGIYGDNEGSEGFWELKLKDPRKSSPMTFVSELRARWIMELYELLINAAKA
jgi:hypothetical protein